MKFISFSKYKNYLESIGYSAEKYKSDYSGSLGFITYFFSKPGEEDKYFVNVYTTKNGISDNIMSMHYGHGSFYAGGIKPVKVDMRRKFWKDLC